MTYTPKNFSHEPYADTLYRGIGRLNEWMESDPKRVLRCNDMDYANCELLETLFEQTAADPKVSQEAIEMADEAFFLATTLFWVSVCFAMAYRMQVKLVDELAAVPTEEGEEEIASLRETLAELQELFLNSPVFGAARSRAALAGDAEFVTSIDFSTPKWHKPADSIDLDDSEKK